MEFLTVRLDGEVVGLVDRDIDYSEAHYSYVRGGGAEVPHAGIGTDGGGKVAAAVVVLG